MENLKSERYKLNYKCVASIGCDRIPEGWDCVGKITKDLGHNCKNHAAAMHYALKKIEAGTVIFVDADICILYPNWDHVVITELNKTPIWGTAFGDKSRQYHRFPNVFFFCFKSGLLKGTDFDFFPDITPGGESPVRKKIETNYEAKAWNKNIGEQVKCDTGYRMPIVAYASNIKYGYMPRVLGGDRISQLPFRDDEQRAFCYQKPEHMAEWHYRGELFLSHLQASRNHGVDSEWGKVWMDRIELFLLQELKYIEFITGVKYV